MSTASEPFQNNYGTGRDKKKDKYVCDCGRKCIDKADLDQHKLTNCENRIITCSFCQEAQPSSSALSAHLMTCGNKTDECPNCRKFIRRAIFAYHYENNCADLEETDASPVRSRDPPAHRPRSSSHRPASRENLIRDRDQEDDSSSDYPSKSTERIRLSTSKSKDSPRRINCEYCGNECVISDYVTHKDNCLSNPTNVNKQFQRTSLKSNETRIRTPRNERDTSNDIVRIPCEYCDEQIELSNLSTHTEVCREKHNRRIEARAKTINREPVIEQLPCEHCEQLFSVEKLRLHEITCKKNPDYIARATKLSNSYPLTTTLVPMRTSKTDRDLRLSSTSYSLQPSSMSASNLSSESRDIVNQIDDPRRRSALQNDRLSFQSNTDVSRRNELDRLDYTAGSSVVIPEHYSFVRRNELEKIGYTAKSPVVVVVTRRDPSVERKMSNDNGSRLINSSPDPPAYGTLPLLSNERGSSGNYSVPYRSGSTTSYNTQQRTRREMPPTTVHSNFNSLRSQSATRDSRNDRGSERQSSAIKSLHSLANKTIFFNSPRDEDQEYQPVLNGPSRTATKFNKSNGTASVRAPWK